MLHMYLPYPYVALLCQRLMIAAIFLSSGWSDVRDPDARSKSIGMNKGFTIFLGMAEIAGALGVATGVLANWAALGLILLMLGAIYKKMVVWKTGFWGKGSQGWHYDLIMIVMNLVILTVGPGTLVLFRL
jgi:putative oxidoreductase